MTGTVAGWGLDRLAARRRRTLEQAWKEPLRQQEATLRHLVDRAHATAFGRAHEFAAIRSIADYQRHVPLREYLDFRPLWGPAVAGERDVTWPGRIAFWVKTSGTTAGDKLIPVSRSMFASHRQGGWDALLLAGERMGGRHLLGGPLLFLGGSTQLSAVGRHGLVGDLSGLVVRRLPPGLRGRYAPGPRLGAIADWESRMSAVAAATVGRDVRLLAGMPSWVLVFFDHLDAAMRAAGRAAEPIGQCWPHLGVFIHGGVSFEPYRALFEQRIGRPLERLEVYPASEAFVALQTERTGGLTLMLDYGVFYEFVPVDDLGQPRPRRHTVADVETGRSYAVVITTPAGLWSYVLGDTVRFVSRDPLTLEITGRVRHFVNAFGENVIVDEVERAALAAAQRTAAQITEFTVAPWYPRPGEPRGAHEWLIEFQRAPDDEAEFERVLDQTLMGLNADYRTKRAGNVGMLPPRVVAIPEGTFYRWMRGAGKLGDQHKVPRVTNDRQLVESIHGCATVPVAARGLSVPSGELAGRP